jgi:CBS domain containing-hemolysin-like protein
MDWIIGTHGKSRFCNSDLRSLIELHTVDALKNLDVVEDEHQDSEKKELKEGETIGLSKEQVNYMVGALDISSKKAFDIMIPIEKTTMIDYHSKIDSNFIQDLLKKGFSRIPVYMNDPDNIIGILRIKQLIGIDITKPRTFKELKITLSSPLIISKNMLAMDLLTEFRKGRSHMAFITESSNVEKLQRRLGLDTNNSLRDYTILSKLEKGDNKGNYVKILGIVTIEDVLEKMFNIEILDEDDYNKGKKKDNLKKVLTKQITQSFIDKKKSLLNDMIEHSNKDTIIEENNPYTLYEGYDEYKDEKQKDYII